MTEKQSNTASSNVADIKPVKLEFRGYDKNMDKASQFKRKVATIKNKIADSIQKNMTFEKDGSQLPASMRMLEDTDTHTVITLRCGAYKIFQNTTTLNQYSHLQILVSLDEMLKNGAFDKEIIAYANKKIKKKSTTNTTTSTSSTKENTPAADAK